MGWTSRVRMFAVLLVALAGAASALNAATIVVTSTADAGPDAPLAGTLRAALAKAANGDIIDATGIAGTITLKAGAEMDSAQLVVDKSVAILGPGPATLTVDANRLSRVFLVKPGHTVRIEGLRIVRGQVNGSGGGIRNDRSDLTVNNCILDDNSANGGGVSGGGIYSAGVDGGRATLTVNGCTVSRNSAFTRGGIANLAADDGVALLTVSNSTVSGNSSEYSGGGIGNQGSFGGSATLIVERSTITGNSANLLGGGGIENLGYGGTAILTVRDSTLSGNTTNERDGGGIHNSGVGRDSRTEATILNSTFSGNSARYGGAIFNDGKEDKTVKLVVGNCTLSGNLAIFGGAIVNDDGDATILACTLSGNSATGHTGGISGSVPRNGVGGGPTRVGYTIFKQGEGANLNANITSLGFNLSSDNGAGFLTGTGDQINRDPRLGPLADNGGPTLTHLPLAGSPAIDRGSSDLMATLGLTTDQRGLPRAFDDPGSPNAGLTDGTDIGAVEVQQPAKRNLFWKNLAGGDWNAAENWIPGFVPGTNDNVIINLPGTITLSGPAACFGLTLGSSSNAPTLTGGGTLTVHGPSAWFSGTMSGSGRTVVEAGATLSIPTTGGNFPVLNTRTLENRGTILLSRSLVGVIGGAVITNGLGGSFEAENPDAAVLGGGIANGRFDNAGEFLKAIGSGPLTLSSGLRFNNSGSVSVEANLLLCDDAFTNNGTILLAPATTNQFASGGAGTGTFSVPATALVEWTRGTFTLEAGAQLNGTGLYRISSPATVAANASFAVQNLDIVAGTLGGTGTVTIGNVMNWTGGTMSGGGRTIIPAGSRLNANLPSGGGLNARTLENAGTVFWTGAGNLGFVSAVITNLAGATFEATGAGGISFVSGLNRFDNSGLFRKSVHDGSLEIVDSSGGSSFNNFGTLEIQAGTFHCNAGFTNPGTVRLADSTTLRLARGGSATGTFETPGTALMEWTGRSFALNPGARLNGPGLHRINGTSANVAVNGDVSVQNLDLVSGDSALTALSGVGNLTIEHAMNWTGGAMSGAGRTIVSPAATLSLANANSIGLLRTLANAGTVAWTGSGIIGLLNGVITNQAGAVFEVSSAGRLAYSGGTCRFDNAGTFRKLGTSGTTTLDAGLPFHNAGTVDIRGGVLAANGGFVSTESSLLNFALGGTQAGSSHGQLRSSGTITLNGGLSVELLPGYTPALNDSFTVLAAGTRAGVFNKFSYPRTGAGLQLGDTPNSVIVSATGRETPELLVFPPLFTSSSVSLCWVGESNKTYQLEFSPDLGSTNWIAVPGEVNTSADKTCIADLLTTSNRFYRIRVLP